MRKAKSTTTKHLDRLSLSLDERIELLANILIEIIDKEQENAEPVN